MSKIEENKIFFFFLLVQNPSFLPSFLPGSSCKFLGRCLLYLQHGRAEGGAWVRIELSGVPFSDAACVRRKARADTRPRETRNPGGTGRTSQRTAAPVEFLLSVSIIVETNL